MTSTLGQEKHILSGVSHQIIEMMIMSVIAICILDWLCEIISHVHKLVISDAVAGAGLFKNIFLMAVYLTK